jgi:hypothetical protein
MGRKRDPDSIRAMAESAGTPEWKMRKLAALGDREDLWKRYLDGEPLNRLWAEATGKPRTALPYMPAIKRAIGAMQRAQLEAIQAALDERLAEIERHERERAVLATFGLDVPAHVPSAARAQAMREAFEKARSTPRPEPCDGGDAKPPNHLGDTSPSRS